jgi:hypothetical protein
MTRTPHLATRCQRKDTEQDLSSWKIFIGDSDSFTFYFVLICMMTLLSFHVVLATLACFVNQSVSVPTPTPMFESKKSRKATSSNFSPSQSAGHDVLQRGTSVSRGKILDFDLNAFPVEEGHDLYSDQHVQGFSGNAWMQPMPPASTPYTGIHHQEPDYTNTVNLYLPDASYPYPWQKHEPSSSNARNFPSSPDPLGTGE